MKNEIVQRPHSADWPTLLKDNARSGGQAQHAVHAPERALWQYRAGGSARSSPILFEGVLFVTSVDGMLHAIDAATGIAKWKFRGEAQVHSTASIRPRRLQEAWCSSGLKISSFTPWTPTQGKFAGNTKPGLASRLPRQCRGMSPFSAARTVSFMRSRLRPDICAGKPRPASWS